MTGFKRADLIKVKNDMEIIQKELNELKEKFSIDELGTLFNEMIVILGNYCRHDCKELTCNECRIGKLMNIIETKIAELRRIKALELEYLRLFNEYAEYVIEEVENDLKELEQEVLTDE